MVTWDWINKHEGQRDFINPWLHKFDIYFYPWASILCKPLHAYGTNVSSKCWRVRVTVKIIGEKGVFSFVRKVRRETAQWIGRSIYWTSAQLKGVTGQKWKKWKSSEVSEHTHFLKILRIQENTRDLSQSKGGCTVCNENNEGLQRLKHLHCTNTK